MATVTLIATRNAACGILDPGVVTDILWMVASPDDGLEHVHSHSAARRIDLTLFHRSRSHRDATRAATRLCERAIRHAPALRGWALAGGPPPLHDSRRSAP